MKANDFVKNFGWDRAKREVALIGTIAMMCGDNDFNNDLKRLVESWELVEEFDDLEQAKSWVADMDIEMPYQVKGSNRRFMKDELIQAIADVESCS